MNVDVLGLEDEGWFSSDDDEDQEESLHHLPAVGASPCLWLQSHSNSFYHAFDCSWYGVFEMRARSRVGRTVLQPVIWRLCTCLCCV